MEMHTSDPFSKAFDYASGCTAERFQNPLWPMTELVMGRRFRESISKVRAFGSRIIANAVKTRQSEVLGSMTKAQEGKSDRLSGSLINSLLDSIGDQQLVADAALNYLSAGEYSYYNLSSCLTALGRDTVAQALTWTFYLLMRHSEVVRKIRQEVDQLSSLPAKEDGRSPSYTLGKFIYTHATFLESLRLYPPIPFELKQCLQSTTLPDGTQLPASSLVVWCPWAMNRSTLIWGTDAHEYKPERWIHTDLNDKMTVVTKSAAEFPVFNGGPRLCLGKKMAEEVAVRVIASFVGGFDFMGADDGKERKSRNSLTLPMDGGLPCHVKARER